MNIKMRIKDDFLLNYITNIIYSVYYLRMLKPFVPSGPLGILITLSDSKGFGFTILILQERNEII